MKPDSFSSGPVPTCFSTSSRTASRSSPIFPSTATAVPCPSRINPRRRCSVPTKLWRKRSASRRASASTCWARGVKFAKVSSDSWLSGGIDVFNSFQNDFSQPTVIDFLVRLSKNKIYKVSQVLVGQPFLQPFRHERHTLGLHLRDPRTRDDHLVAKGLSNRDAAGGFVHDKADVALPLLRLDDVGEVVRRNFAVGVQDIDQQLFLPAVSRA